MQAIRPEPSKWIPPATPFGYVERPRLATRLASLESVRFTVLHAPPGYGKTAVLASVAASWDARGRSPAGPLAWYSLDRRDDDAAVFVEGMVRAVNAVVPAAGRNTISVLRGLADATPELDRLLGVLCREIQEAGVRTVYLVLDDFHLIADKSILSSLEQLLRDARSPLRLIVATETVPTYYLSTLRSHGGLLEIEEEELRFTPEEVARLVGERGSARLSSQAVESVVRETRGWPSAAAVAAAIVSYAGTPLPFTRLAPTEHGYGQLVKEVVNRLPVEIGQALLLSSLLPVVQESMLRDLGAPSAGLVLDAIEKLALPAAFVAAPEPTIRFDASLRAALERELVAQTPPHELRRLHKEVALYLAGAGLWDEALDRYLKGWAHEEAASLLEQVASDEIAAGHVDTVLRWLRAVPNVTRKGRPRLMVLEARALLARREVQEARVLLSTVEPQLRAVEDQQGLGERSALLSEVLFAESRYRESAEAARDALSRLADDDHERRGATMLALGRSLEMLGDLGASADASAGGLLEAERSGDQQFVVRALQQLSRILELKGQYAEALSLAFRAVDRSKLLGTEDLAVLSCGDTAGSVYLERGQFKEASAVAARMLAASERLGDAVGRLKAQLLVARSTEVADGSFSDGTADALLSAAGTGPETAMDRVRILQWVSACLLRRGRRREGIARARLAEKVATSTGHQPSVIVSRILAAGGESVSREVQRALQQMDARRWLAAANRISAQRYVQIGNRWWARDRLHKSLSLAAREGYVGMPLGLPSRAASLFEFAVRHDIEPLVAGSLLGVEPERARRVLEPLLTGKNASLKARAEAAVKGLESGVGRAPEPRLVWPGDEAGSRPSQVAIQALGGIGSFVDGQTVSWPTEDARNLAAYFVVRREISVPRGVILEEVWPGVPEHEAMSRLHVALADIRQALGAGYPQVDPALEAAGEYRWDCDGCSIDVERFRALMRALDERMDGERELPLLSGTALGILEEAVGIYQGEFLAGIEFAWCSDQREELRSRLLLSTRMLMDHFMALRDWRNAIRYGVKSLKSDPLQEDVVRDLMLCYFRIGDRSSVTSQYRELKRVVARERGAWPSEETIQLRVRLLGK